MAFSSTNVPANLMGGILLRFSKPFRIGNFVRVGEHVGRVSERGLFDTEIQTENRELIAFLNTYLIIHPITTKRLITARSNLCRSVLDALHGQGIEILSLEMALKDAAEADRSVLRERMELACRRLEVLEQTATQLDVDDPPAGARPPSAEN